LNADVFYGQSLIISALFEKIPSDAKQHYSNLKIYEFEFQIYEFEICQDKMKMCTFVRQ